MVKRGAHPSIVSQLLFDKANAVKGRRPAFTGKLTSQTLLNGLVHCYSCNGFMQVASVGRDQAGYACRNPHCTQRAAIRASILDPEVESRVLTYIARRDDPTITRHEAETEEADHAEAKRALDEAIYDRKKFIGNREIRRLLSDEEYAEELNALNEALEEAQIVYDLSEPLRSEPEVVRTS